MECLGFGETAQVIKGHGEIVHVDESAGVFSPQLFDCNFERFSERPGGFKPISRLIKPDTLVAHSDDVGLRSQLSSGCIKLSDDAHAGVIMHLLF